MRTSSTPSKPSISAEVTRCWEGANDRTGAFRRRLRVLGLFVACLLALCASSGCGQQCVSAGALRAVPDEIPVDMDEAPRPSGDQHFWFVRSRPTDDVLTECLAEATQDATLAAEAVAAAPEFARPPWVAEGTSDVAVSHLRRFFWIDRDAAPQVGGVFAALQPSCTYRAAYEARGLAVGEAVYAYWPGVPGEGPVLTPPTEPAARYSEAQDAALVLLWEHFGRRPFKFRSVDHDVGSWVIGRRGDDEAGVFLGDCFPKNSGGGTYDIDVQREGRLRPGFVYAREQLPSALFAAIRAAK